MGTAQGGFSHCRVDEGNTVKSCRINRLLFAVGLLLLASPGPGHALDRFSVVCEQARMKISVEKTSYYVSP